MTKVEKNDVLYHFVLETRWARILHSQFYEPTNLFDFWWFLVFLLLCFSFDLFFVSFTSSPVFFMMHETPYYCWLSFMGSRVMNQWHHKKLQLCKVVGKDSCCAAAGGPRQCDLGEITCLLVVTFSCVNSLKCENENQLCEQFHKDCVHKHFVAFVKQCVRVLF